MAKDDYDVNLGFRKKVMPKPTITGSSEVGSNAGTSPSGPGYSDTYAGSRIHGFGHDAPGQNGNRTEVAMTTGVVTPMGAKKGDTGPIPTAWELGSNNVPQPHKGGK